MPKVDLYNLGSSGVDLTRSKIHADDGSLRSAQNAVPDYRGEAGGLGKRDGLTAINSSAAAGSIQGAVQVSLPAAITNRFYIGIDQDATSAYQWVTSSDAFATTGTATSPVAPHYTGWTISTPVVGNWYGRAAVSTGRRIYFPQHHVQYSDAGHVPPRILMFDGTETRVVASIPLNKSEGATSNAQFITEMLLDGDRLFCIVIDNQTALGSARKCRVFMLNLLTNAVEQMGESFGSASGELGAGSRMAWSLGFHNGQLFVGLGAGTTSTVTGLIYRIRPGVDTAWTLDATLATDENPISFASYKGKLYAGTAKMNVTAEARLMVRDTDNTWSQSTATSGATGNGSFWGPLIVFGDNLYAGNWIVATPLDIARIYKFDNSSWSLVHTIDDDSATSRRPISAVVHNSKIYFLSSNGASGEVSHSSNGSSWTDIATNLTTGVMSHFAPLVLET